MVCCVVFFTLLALTLAQQDNSISCNSSNGALSPLQLNLLTTFDKTEATIRKLIQGQEQQKIIQKINMIKTNICDPKLNQNILSAMTTFIEKKLKEIQIKIFLARP
ncbi:hypothetical protein FKM82_014787 [Ascaphus truei]